MLVGDINEVAIESSVTRPYRSASCRGLGFFVVYVGGKRYGVYSPEATLLACSFDEVNSRISRRGRHVVDFTSFESAIRIADAYLGCTYYDDQEVGAFLGLTCEQFRGTFSAACIAWAPDGDEAFDDGSHILHFDQSESVRLIAFKNSPNKGDVASSLSEINIKADAFYGVLREWRDRFEIEWTEMIKFVD